MARSPVEQGRSISDSTWRKESMGLASLFRPISTSVRSPFAYRSPLCVGRTGTPIEQGDVPERSLIWERLLLVDKRGFSVKIKLVVPIRSGLAERIGLFVGVPDLGNGQNPFVVHQFSHRQCVVYGGQPSVCPQPPRFLLSRSSCA